MGEMTRAWVRAQQPSGPGVPVATLERKLCCVSVHAPLLRQLNPELRGWPESATLLIFDDVSEVGDVSGTLLARRPRKINNVLACCFEAGVRTRKGKIRACGMYELNG